MENPLLTEFSKAFPNNTQFLVDNNTFTRTVHNTKKEEIGQEKMFDRILNIVGYNSAKHTHGLWSIVWENGSLSLKTYTSDSPVITIKHTVDTLIDSSDGTARIDAQGSHLILHHRANHFTFTKEKAHQLNPQYETKLGLTNLKL